MTFVGLSEATTYPRGCQETEVVQHFDQNAYLGRWYEIVRDKDTSYEHGICATPNYFLREDGNIRIRNNEWIPEDNAWSGGDGYAYQNDPSKDEGYLKVKFSP